VEGRTVRILIVDDQQHTRSALRALLGAEMPGVVMDEAENGAVAARLADTLLPDLVIMDYRMPVLDGIAATRLIRERHPGVRIIVHSLDGRVADRARKAGANAFVGKAEPPAALLEAVRSLLDDAGLDRPLGCP
jgi:DNA-binding NarL/FixJ family response regulator